MKKEKINFWELGKWAALLVPFWIVLLVLRPEINWDHAIMAIIVGLLSPQILSFGAYVIFITTVYMLHENPHAVLEKLESSKDAEISSDTIDFYKAYVVTWIVFALIYLYSPALF